MHQKKTKGDVAVGRVIARLLDMGWNVGVPISEHHHYDLFAEKNGTVHTIQVKYTARTGNKAELRLSTNWADKNGSHTRNRENGDFSVLAAYVPDEGVFFLREEDLNECVRSVNIRFDKPKNGQNKGIRYACNFTELE